MNYVEISVLTKSDAKVPYFIGSKIRGIFGYFLKNVTCRNPKYLCEDCFASELCLFYQFYEKKNTFHNYRFAYELGKPYYDFQLYLFEDACQETPYVLLALDQMLKESQLKNENNDFGLFINGESCYKDGKLILVKNYKQSFEISKDDKVRKVKVTFQTPLRIKKNNVFLKNPEELTLKDIITSIYQRKLGLTKQPFQAYKNEIKGEIKERNLQYKELKRFSNRQNAAMNLDGIMGDFYIENLDSSSYNLLKLGELIGAGKQCVFGLGKMEIKEIENDSAELL